LDRRKLWPLDTRIRCRRSARHSKVLQARPIRVNQLCLCPSPTGSHCLLVKYNNRMLDANHIIILSKQCLTASVLEVIFLLFYLLFRVRFAITIYIVCIKYSSYRIVQRYENEYTTLVQLVKGLWVLI